jgi:hypothetical protein
MLSNVDQSKALRIGSTPNTSVVLTAFWMAAASAMSVTYCTLLKLFIMALQRRVMVMPTELIDII